MDAPSPSTHFQWTKRFNVPGGMGCYPTWPSLLPATHEMASLSWIAGSPSGLCATDGLPKRAFRIKWWSAPVKHRARLSCSLSFSMGDLAPQVPRWADPLMCSFNAQCADGDCEYLHVREDERGKPCVVPQAPAKLVICAGPERSGSTWLFNALRFILEATGERVHSYWMHHVTQAEFEKRGVGLHSDAAHVLVKTHKWSNDWDPMTADLIVLTERDICGVMNSYLRVGWIPKDMGYLKRFIEGYIKDHERWRQVSHAILQYDDIADVGGRELACLSCLLDLLGIKQDPATISGKIQSLSVPDYGRPDPITKLWPRHTKLSDQQFMKRPSLSEQECRALKEYASSLCKNEYL